MAFWGKKKKGEEDGKGLEEKVSKDKGSDPKPSASHQSAAQPILPVGDSYGVAPAGESNPASPVYYLLRGNNLEGKMVDVVILTHPAPGFTSKRVPVPKDVYDALKKTPREGYQKDATLRAVLGDAADKYFEMGMVREYFPADLGRKYADWEKFTRPWAPSKKK
jgi:hypothetical protein